MDLNRFHKKKKEYRENELIVNRNDLIKENEIGYLLLLVNEIP